MPGQLLINPRRPLAAALRTRRKSLSRLGALLVLLAACGSESATPSDGTEGSVATANNAAGGAAASQPTASQTTQKSPTASATPTASNTPTAPASAGAGQSNPATPATPNMTGAQQPAMPNTSMNAPDPMAAMDPMADPKADAEVKLPVDMGTPTLYWLEIASGIVSTGPADGSAAKNVPSGGLLSAPDGVTIDPESKKFWVLNMGSVVGGGNSGSLVRYNLDGTGGEVVMKPGTKVGNDTFNTGKQVTIDRVNKKLYMGDREGSKVWRCDYDGQNLEVLVSEHDVQQIVGVGADPTKRHFYFTDRNGKKLFRAGMDMPAGETHSNRTDVELIYVEKAASAMPLDIELDLEERMIYWTDRTQGKILGMHMDMPMGETAENRTDVKTIASNLTQAIGLAYDHQEKILYTTHSGTVSQVPLDGSGAKAIYSNGSTGIAFARIQ